MKVIESAAVWMLKYDRFLKPRHHRGICTVTVWISFPTQWIARNGVRRTRTNVWTRAAFWRKSALSRPIPAAVRRRAPLPPFVLTPASRIAIAMPTCKASSVAQMVAAGLVRDPWPSIISSIHRSRCKSKVNEIRISSSKFNGLFLTTFPSFSELNLPITITITHHYSVK